MPRVTLAIGFGNLLRGDDGVGVKVAKAIATLALPDVRVKVVQQLVPELAALLASVDRAIFIDAVAGGETLQVSRLQPNRMEGCQFGHDLVPASLLAMTEALYGCSPNAWAIAIPAVNFGFGEALSPVAVRGAEAAETLIREFLTGDREAF